MDPLSSVLAPRAYHQGKEAEMTEKDLVGLERCRYCIRSVCALNIPNNTRYPGCKNYKPEEEGKVSCLYCNRRPFKTARAVIQHQVARHRYLFCPKVPHKTCSGCGQTFQSEQLYNNHVCAWPLKKKEPWPVEKEDLNEEEDVEMESSNEKKEDSNVKK